MSCASKGASTRRWSSWRRRSRWRASSRRTSRTNRQWQRELALAQRDVARVLDDQGRSDAALDAYRAALAVSEQLARAAPTDAGAQRALLTRYSDLAQLQERTGRRAEAQRSYCQAKAIVRALSDLEPGNDEWRERRAWLEQRLRATHDAEAALC
jgi:tetratricopeptide (TPR) repeat protein